MGWVVLITGFGEINANDDSNSEVLLTVVFVLFLLTFVVSQLIVRCFQSMVGLNVSRNGIPNIISLLDNSGNIIATHVNGSFIPGILTVKVQISFDVVVVLFASVTKYGSHSSVSMLFNVIYDREMQLHAAPLSIITVALFHSLMIHGNFNSFRIIGCNCCWVDMSFSMSHCFIVVDVFSLVIMVEFIGINDIGDKSLLRSVFSEFNSVFAGICFSLIFVVLGVSMCVSGTGVSGGLSGGAGGIYLCFTGRTNSAKLNIFLYWK